MLDTFFFENTPDDLIRLACISLIVRMRFSVKCLVFSNLKINNYVFN
jgi:hypothetical protein